MSVGNYPTSRISAGSFELANSHKSIGCFVGMAPGLDLDISPAVNRVQVRPRGAMVEVEVFGPVGDRRMRHVSSDEVVTLGPEEQLHCDGLRFGLPFSRKWRKFGRPGGMMVRSGRVDDQ